MRLTAAVRSKALFREGMREGARDFVVLIPRVMIGVVGSGYIAAVMPQDLITHWIGPNSGLFGITIATLAGAATPGGAVVGFSIGAAALKGGAGAPQVIAYSTAWSLYALQRLFNWEIHMMSPQGGVAAGAGLDPAAVPRRHRRAAGRKTLTPGQCITAASRGMMAPRWRITSPARRCAAAAAACGPSPDSRAAI